MPARRPLEGIRVLDHFHWWAGPTATRLLANMGAEVIKIEAARHYDGSRLLMNVAEPSDTSHEWSPHHNCNNHDKYYITLDLTLPKGKELFKELIKISDVFTESVRPGLMKSFGFGYEDVRAIKPDIIYIAPNFGLGPWSHYVGWGANFGHMSGGGYLHAYEDDEIPIGAGPLLYSDPAAGLHMAFAILAALFYRKRTGKGQYIDLSQVETQTGFYSPYIMDYFLNGRVAGFQGNRDPQAAPHNMYRARPEKVVKLVPASPGSTEGEEQEVEEEKWVAIAVTTQEEWKALCHVMGEPAWARDRRFATASGRWKHQVELDKRVQEWTQQHGRHELMETLQQAGVPCGAVLNHAEVLQDPHFEARGTFKVAERPVTGAHLYTDFPFKFSKTPCSIRWASPAFGQHNGLVFKELLGLTDKDMEELEAQGVIASKPSWRPVT